MKMKSKFRTHLAVSSFLALRSITKDKKKVILTVFIISLGFISSIIIFGLLKDVAFKLQQDYIDTYFGNIILESYERGKPLDNVQNILDKLDTLPDIVGAAAISKISARIYDSQGEYLDREIWIVNPEDFEKATLIAELLHEGDYLNKRDKNKFFSGCINLESCSDFTTGFPFIDQPVGKMARFAFSSGESANITLKGNYKHSFAYVENLVLINEETAKDIFKDYGTNHSDFIIIRLPNKDLTQKVVQEISFLGVDAKILTWADKTAFTTQIIDSFNIIGNLSFLIGVVIAVISVYIILYINALNKKVQIGVMRAIGIKSRIIVMSYTIQGLVYGVLGSMLGILLTFAMILYFRFVPFVTSIGSLVPVAPFNIFLLVTTTVTLASTLTGYIVSKRIIKQKILESILNE